MSWLWNKNERKTMTSGNSAGAPTLRAQTLEKRASNSAKTEPYTLQAVPDSVKTELYQLAHVIPVVAGNPINIEPGTFCLNVDTELRVLSEDRVLLTVASVACIGPVMLAQLQIFTVIPRSSGTVLYIDAKKLLGASDNLREFINSVALEFDQSLVVALLSQNYRLLEQNKRLGDELFQEAIKSRASFVDSELVHSVLKRIPKLPVSSAQLLTSLQDSDSSASQVTEFVIQDPSLASVLLKTINSSLYSFEKPVTDVNRIIVLLGYEGVYQLIMAAGLRSSLPETKIFQASYSKAIEMSHLAFAVALASGKASPVEMSTIGLLFDVGLLVSVVLRKQNPNFKGVLSLVDIGELGGALLSTWELPESISRTVSAQRHPKFAGPSSLDAELLNRIAILYLADQLHSQMMNASNEKELYLEEYVALLGWPGLSIEAVWQGKILPVLRSRKNALPVSMRAL